SAVVRWPSIRSLAVCCLPRLLRPPPRPTLFPYTTLFRSTGVARALPADAQPARLGAGGGDHRRLRGHSHPGLLRSPTRAAVARADRKSTRLNSSHVKISYAVFCLKKKKSTRTI